MSPPVYSEQKQQTAHPGLLMAHNSTMTYGQVVLISIELHTLVYEKKNRLNSLPVRNHFPHLTSQELISSPHPAPRILFYRNFIAVLVKFMAYDSELDKFY